MTYELLKKTVFVRCVVAGRSHLEKPAEGSESLSLETTELAAVPKDGSELYSVMRIVAFVGEEYAVDENTVT